MSAYLVARLEPTESDESGEVELYLQHGSTTTGVTLTHALSKQRGDIGGELFAVWENLAEDEFDHRQPDYVISVSAYHDPFRLDPQHLAPVIF